MLLNIWVGSDNLLFRLQTVVLFELKVPNRTGKGQVALWRMDGKRAINDLSE